MSRPDGGTARDSAGAAAAAAAAADVRAAAADSTWVGVSRRAIASYDDHTGAEQALDRLADHRFPMERASAVGVHPMLAERMTGTLAPGMVAGRSALSGALIGAPFGWLLDAFDLMDPVIAAPWLALNGAILGAVLGAVVGLLGFLVTRGRRTFTAAGNIAFERFDVLVDTDLADEAAHVLHGRGTGGTWQPAATGRPSVAAPEPSADAGIHRHRDG